MTIWDRGRYETEKWSDREVKIVLHGERAEGRFVLFHTGGKNWMIHRMDAPARRPTAPATAGSRCRTWSARCSRCSASSPRPAEDDAWAYEMKWDGVRAVAYVDGGRVRLMSRNDLDVTVSYPELRGLGPALGITQVVLDGEIVALDEHGRPSFGRLQQRMHVSSADQARRLARAVPVVYLVFDVLHLDGVSTLSLPYTERRELLEGLGLRGPALAGAAVVRRRRGGRPGGQPRARARGRGGQAADLALPRPAAGRRTGARSRTCAPRRSSSAAGVRARAGARARSARCCWASRRRTERPALRRPVGTGFTDQMLDDLSAG